MVNALCRRALPALVCLLLPWFAAAKDLAEYRLGDHLDEDLVTPVALMVVDPAATEALKEKESLRIPLAFRFDRRAAAVVDRELRAAFAQARTNFLQLLQSSLHHPPQQADLLKPAPVEQLLVAFQKQNPGFPLSLQLAEDWTRGQDGFAEQIKLLARVRQVMEQPIRADILTNAPPLGSQVRLVAVREAQEEITLDDLTGRGTDLASTNLLTLSRARLALREKFGADEVDAAQFAAGCLRANCFVAAELTLATRARHTEALFVADHYQAGQIIARAGQVVDRKLLAALGQIQEKTVAGRLQQQVADEKVQATEMRASNRMLVAGLIGVAVLLLATLAWLAFRRPKPALTLLPAVAGSAAASPLDAGWQQRALEAEAEVARAHEAIRSGVMLQLKDKAMGSLLTQRSDLLEAQHAAATEMAELERRLNELHAPLQDRLRAYETRIADLERALAAKGEENRELIRAKIGLMRQQLEVERTGNKLQFN